MTGVAYYRSWPKRMGNAKPVPAVGAKTSVAWGRIRWSGAFGCARLALTDWTSNYF